MDIYTYRHFLEFLLILVQNEDLTMIIPNNYYDTLKYWELSSPDVVWTPLKTLGYGLEHGIVAMSLRCLNQGEGKQKKLLLTSCCTSWVLKSLTLIQINIIKRNLADGLRLVINRHFSPNIYSSGILIKRSQFNLNLWE